MRTRFAPSPTGPLHLGHAYSALIAYELAQKNVGECLLRIEDIDQSRARGTWEEMIYDDLKWLGFEWVGHVARQSERMPQYTQALEMLWSRDLLYPCHCARRDIVNALSAPQEGHPIGPDGIIYPGTCRDLPRPETMPRNVALRLDMAKAVGEIPKLSFTEMMFGTQAAQVIDLAPLDYPNTIGDIVLARKDMGTSYHLSVVIDDADQQITDVVRGEDLFDATKIHVLLQRLMGFSVPTYHHHKLIRDENGRRLAKRDDARSIQSYRQSGLTRSDVLALITI